MRDSVLTVELETFAAVKKTTVAQANLFQGLYLIELTMLVHLHAVAINLYTFSVLSSHGGSVMFIADV